MSSLTNLPALRSGDGAYQSGIPFPALRGLLREFASHPQNPGDFKIVVRKAAALQAAALLAGSTSEPYNLDLVITANGQRARLLIHHQDGYGPASAYSIFDMVMQTLIGNQMSPADSDLIEGILSVGDREVELIFTQGRGYDSHVINRLLPRGSGHM